jgi:hypothetical protein
MTSTQLLPGRLPTLRNAVRRAFGLSLPVPEWPHGPPPQQHGSFGPGLKGRWKMEAAVPHPWKARGGWLRRGCCNGQDCGALRTEHKAATRERHEAERGEEATQGMGCAELCCWCCCVESAAHGSAPSPSVSQRRGTRPSDAFRPSFPPFRYYPDQERPPVRDGD